MRRHVKHQLSVLHKHLLEIEREAESIRQYMTPSELARWENFLYNVEETNRDFYLEVWEDIYDE